MNLRVIIDKLLGFERRVRAIYLTLSERQDFSAEAREFWRDMAEDENRHREYYEQTAGLLNFVKVPPPVSDAAFRRVDEAIAYAEQKVQQPGLTMDDSLRQALTLETSELQRLEDRWLKAFAPSLYFMRNDPIAQEEEHLRRLLNATHVLSTDKELHAQAEAMWLAYQQRVAPGQSSRT